MKMIFLSENEIVMDKCSNQAKINSWVLVSPIFDSI